MKRGSGSIHRINEASVRLYCRMPLDREDHVGLIQCLLDALLDL
jgi:hypothetical protein